MIKMLSKPEQKILKQIFETPGIFGEEIIRKTGLGHSTVRRYLKTLIENDFIIMKKNGIRKIPYELTAKGKKIAELI